MIHYSDYAYMVVVRKFRFEINFSVVYCVDLCNLFKKRIMALVVQFNRGTEICSGRLRPDIPTKRAQFLLNNQILQ